MTKKQIAAYIKADAKIMDDIELLRQTMIKAIKYNRVKCK